MRVVGVVSRCDVKGGACLRQVVARRASSLTFTPLPQLPLRVGIKPPVKWEAAGTIQQGGKKGKQVFRLGIRRTVVCAARPPAPAVARGGEKVAVWSDWSSSAAPPAVFGVCTGPGKPETGVGVVCIPT